jgi:hypothetical protein
VDEKGVWGGNVRSVQVRKFLWILVRETIKAQRNHMETHYLEV